MSSSLIASRLVSLSPREQEVTSLVTRGLPNKLIARELQVTEGTVKLHLHRIYRKLGAKSRFDLAARIKDISRSQMR